MRRQGEGMRRQGEGMRRQGEGMRRQGGGKDALSQDMHMNINIIVVWEIIQARRVRGGADQHEEEARLARRRDHGPQERVQPRRQILHPVRLRRNDTGPPDYAHILRHCTPPSSPLTRIGKIRHKHTEARMPLHWGRTAKRDWKEGWSAGLGTKGSA